MRLVLQEMRVLSDVRDLHEHLEVPTPSWKPGLLQPSILVQGPLQSLISQNIRLPLKG